MAVPPARLIGFQRVLALAAAFVAAAAWAQPKAPEAAIYTCTIGARKITADRPIAECADREQRILNKDGSLRAVLPPSMTAEERADREARDRRAAEVRAAQNDAVRRDRNLMARYPSEDAHNRAREAALDTVRLAIRASDQRLKELAVERKPILDETEFYKGRALPLKLRQQLDANDASTEAQRSAMTNQEAELVRINRLYDTELDRLRRLWSGAQPGTLGPLAAHDPSAAPRQP